ncbi:MAG: DUF1697 domain-containing protein [Anaerolineae bacterium]|nr:DUF1697 domain-containing protein [Anaerolineae bacterium]
MRRYFAFLRAINVGGRNVTMAVLRNAFTSLGLQDVETFIASGNVIFASKSDDCAALESTIEAGLQKTLGYEVRRSCGTTPSWPLSRTAAPSVGRTRRLRMRSMSDSSLGPCRPPAKPRSPDSKQI